MNSIAEVTVEIDTRRILDRPSFHQVFREVMGFPDFYGQNMDAWIDCLGYVDDAEAGMSRVHIAPGQVLVLKLAHSQDFRGRCPEIFAELVDCADFVNRRRTEPILRLSMN